MPGLPTRGVTRGVKLASLPAAFVGRRVVGLGRRVGGRPAEAITTEVQARTAEHLFAVLGELKGGAMKAGQWLSAMEAALPEPLAAAYGAAMTRLQEAAPAMPARMVHRVLREDFGSRWRANFTDFDDQPAAAASIGQVHRAVWRDGREVAVKVQYPAAGEALTTDLRQLDRLAPLLRVAAPGLDARGLFAELRARVIAEVDYGQEASAQTAFADGYRDDPDFTVPSVVMSTDNVLVSEWVGGTPLAQVARLEDRSRRDRAGLLLTRFLLGSPVRVGRLHGDPHPGNFRLLDDGRLAVLDFGATLPARHGWPAWFGPLLRAGRDRDAGALLDIAGRAGLVRPGDVTAAALLDLADPVLEPLRPDEFAFTRSWLRGQTVRLADARSTASRTQRRLRIPARYLLGQRVAAGTTGVLCLLDATVPVRAEIAHWVPALADGAITAP